MIWQSAGWSARDIAEIGTIGSVGAGLILKQVFGFLEKRKNGNGGSGALPPEFWLQQFEKNREVTIEAINAAMHPLAEGFGRMEQDLGAIRENTAVLKDRHSRRE